LVVYVKNIIFKYVEEIVKEMKEIIRKDKGHPATGPRGSR